jgi:hypothetical protein
MLKDLFDLTNSIARALLGLSKRMKRPSDVINPKLLVDELTGHSTFSVRVVSVRVVVVRSGLIWVDSRCSVFWHEASTSVPFQVVLVVVVVVVLAWANSRPAVKGIKARDPSLIMHLLLGRVPP